jgi:hypothetical protein
MDGGAGAGDFDPDDAQFSNDALGRGLERANKDYQRG